MNSEKTRLYSLPYLNYFERAMRRRTDLRKVWMHLVYLIREYIQNEVKAYNFYGDHHVLLYLVCRVPAMNSDNSFGKTSDLVMEDNKTQEIKEDIGELRRPLEHDISKYNTDTGYKIFYGEWEAAKK